MSRKIQFRAWDEKSSSWGPLAALRFLKPTKIQHRIKDLQYDGFEVENDDFIIMQFTGLLDKTGKPIYEGDILKNKRLIQFGEYSGRFGMGTGFYTVCHAKDADGLPYGFTSIQAEDDEVQGNLYENPELLTEV